MTTSTIRVEARELPHVTDPTVAGAGASDGAVSALLAEAPIPEALVADWNRATTWQVRTLYVAELDGEVAGVVLAVHRPRTAYEKLAGYWLADTDAADDVLAALLDELHARSSSAGSVVTKLEVRHDDDRLWRAGTAAGFVPLPEPALGAPLPHEPREIPRGLARWTTARTDGAAVPYMRQTTEYTCGAVATSMALASRGLVPIPNRRDELQLWREATLVPACEPFGLAAATLRRGLVPRVVTSAEGPILLEGTTDASVLEMRTFVQADFRARAIADGAEVEQRWISVEEIAEEIAVGQIVLVLIDQFPMHVEPCPHWITAHAVYPGGVLVSDPWTDVELGESWIDASELPVPLTTLDALARWGEPACRAVLLMGPAPVA